MSKRVLPISQVRMCVWEIYDYFTHLDNKGIIEELSEEEQRLYRIAQATINEICTSDWTANYF